jgi:hypothetical protein
MVQVSKERYAEVTRADSGVLAQHSR